VSRPLLSVCIPAYNRASLLPALLDSIVAQDFTDWECVISEDGSRERAEIRAIAAQYGARTGGKVRFHENAETLGYDGNFRKLVELARGEFVFFMGNDDVVCPGAFSAVSEAIARHPRTGVILRAFAVFRGTPDNIVQINRYYPGECTFAAGEHAIVACYRRLVSMSGLVLHRDSAHAAATDRWDGTLFYQQWLAANILVDRDALYIPALLALFRKDGVPEFGNAGAERGLYTPGVQPPDTDIRMIRSLFAIADSVAAERGVPFAAAVRRDFANYSYPTLAHQAHEPWLVFWRFYRDLGALGLDRYLAFHFWFWLIAAFGATNVDHVIQFIRRRLGYTPNLTRAARPTSRRAPAH
jgi:glycosyltransferase involved in cell wall biosynthesis